VFLLALFSQSCPCFFISLSCPHSTPFIFFGSLSKEKGNLLSTREKPPLLWKTCPHLPLRTQFPHSRRDTKNYNAKDRGIRFPVRGLGIPATGRGPDVFGVAVCVFSKTGMGKVVIGSLRNFAAGLERMLVREGIVGAGEKEDIPSCQLFNCEGSGCSSN
jgi:hypothetical protein